jgi:hypothetical protein
MNKYVMAKPMQLRRSQPEFSLFGGTPSGAAMPELIEVLIFDIAADSGGDVSIRELVFDINTTDNAGTGWNVCDLDESMGGMTDDHFLLYDMDNPGQALNGYGSASWTFLAEDMTVCTEDTDVIKYAVLEFDPSYMGEVAAGSIDTYQLYVDTSGASAATDDSIRVDIPPEVTVQDNGADDPDGVVIWEDHDAYEEDGAQFIDGHFIESLPLTGGTIIF